MQSYSDIFKKIEQGLSFRKKTIEDDILRNLDYLKGRYPNNSEIQYTLNIAHSIQETLTTSVYSQDPSFKVEIHADIDDILRETVLDATGYDLKVKTDIAKFEHSLEKITKIYFKEMQSRKTNKRAIADTIWAGYGVTKMGYIFDLDDKLKLLNDKDDVSYNRLAETLDFSDVIKKDEPFKVRVNPLDIILPSDANSLYELDWVCQIVYLDKDEAKKLYGKDLPATATSDFRIQTRDKCDKVKLYEFHSLNPNDPYIYTLCEGNRDFVRVAPHPLYDGKKIKNMFQFIWFNDNAECVYPTPDLSLVCNQLTEINIAVTRRVELLKRVSAVFLANGAIAREELDKLKRAKDGTIVQIDDPNGSVSQMPLLGLGAEFYNNISMMRAEIYEILGLTDYSMGSNVQNRKATEAQLMERSRLDKVQNRINAVEEFVFLQADTFIELMKAFNEQSRSFLLVLSSEDRTRLDFGGTLLKFADIQVQVVAGSTVLLDDNAELRRVTQIAQIAQAFGGIVNTEELFKEFLTRLGYGNNLDRFIVKTTPTPIEERTNGGSPPAVRGIDSALMSPSATPAMQGVSPAESLMGV